MFTNKFFKFIGGFLAFGFTFLQGVDWIFNKYSIDNKFFNYILVLLLIGFLISLLILLFSNKSNFNKNPSTKSKKNKFIKIGNIILTSLLLLLFIYFFRKSNSKDLLLDEILPKISNAYDEGDILYVFKNTTNLLKKYPNNEILKSFLTKTSRNINVSSDLPQTDIYIKFANDSIWSFIGEAPIDSISVPLLDEAADFKLKLISGDLEHVAENEEFGNFELSLIPKLPPNFVLKKAGENQFMNFPGVYFGDDISWPAFGISKYEVTNHEYKKFVDDGGYLNPDFWDFPIKVGRIEYNYEKTIKKFTDKFGRYGPSNWRYGQFPKNEENYPVTNISWFEARAYAKYKKLDLPNVFQWLHAAGLSGFTTLTEVNLSNFNSNKLNEVNYSIQNNLLPNIAGNAREWVNNPNGEDKYSILGGAYMDNTYTFNSYYSLSPFDRSNGNGLRLVKNFTNDKSQDSIKINFVKRNFDLENDVSNEVFEYYKSQFDYKKYPLEVNTSEIGHKFEGYTIEKFEMETPYKSDEKLYGYISYSNKFKNKLKPILHFPSARSLFAYDDSWFVNSSIDEFKHFLDEGYSMVMPVYHSTWSRKHTIDSWWPNESDDYKQTIIKIGKDYKRVIDYIESKEIFDISKLSYVGFSWGSVSSNYLLAIDNRVKSAMISAGGLMLQKSKKEIEPHIFLRRINIPILHIVGTLDGIFEYEESFLPWNKLIGTPEKDKKIIVIDGAGHGLEWDIVIKNQLEFLKKYN